MTRAVINYDNCRAAKDVTAELGTSVEYSKNRKENSKRLHWQNNYTNIWSAAVRYLIYLATESRYLAKR